MRGPVIVSDLETMSGTPCFRGTRVPFQHLVDYLNEGSPLLEFLEDFPTVTKEMALQALDEAQSLVPARIA